MDYGVVHQLIFSNLEQTYGFGRKLIVCILNSFIQGFKSIELIIESKPPKWSNDGGVYPTQYIIFLTTRSRKHHLFGTEVSWPYKFNRKK